MGGESVTRTEVIEAGQEGVASEDDRRTRLLHNRWLQLAAVVAVAWTAFLQGAWFGQGQESPVVYEAGAVVAAGELESVLYDPALGAREEGPSVGDEFRDGEGRACRRFADGPVTGIACRAGGDWRVTEMRQD